MHMIYFLLKPPKRKNKPEISHDQFSFYGKQRTDDAFKCCEVKVSDDSSVAGKAKRSGRSSTKEIFMSKDVRTKRK